jgi:hypothetical protein
MQRTIRLRLKPNSTAAQAFEKTVEAYPESFNAVCKLSWEASLLTNGNTLHKLSYYERANRISQAEFRCKGCGFECSAEINAAMNIRDDYTLRVLPSGRWAVVNQPIVGDCHDSPASLRHKAGGY